LRIVQSTKVVEAESGWREALDVSDRRVVVDVGAGDGRWVYENARRDPDTLFIGLDPDAAALKEYAFKAGRKPSRGGVPNAVYIVGSVESPPPQLIAVADELMVLFPWAALLRGLLLAEEATLRGIVAIAKPGASFELVLTYEASHDRGAGLESDMPSLDAARLEALAAAYGRAGLEVGAYRRLTTEEALDIPSTWGHRLLHGRRREVFRVSGTIGPRS
jgi:16S rRNA (adenine(1408)-N(1))-methyltransferase